MVGHDVNSTNAFELAHVCVSVFPQPVHESFPLVPRIEADKKGKFSFVIFRLKKCPSVLRPSRRAATLPASISQWRFDGKENIHPQKKAAR